MLNGLSVEKHSKIRMANTVKRFYILEQPSTTRKFPSKE